MPRGKRSIWLTAAISGVGLLAGCGSSDGGKPLATQTFYNTQRPPQSLGGPVDRPGPALYDDVKVDLLEKEKAEAARRGDQTPGIAPVVAENVKTPSEQAATPHAPSTTQAASTAPANIVPSGEYMTIGGVVAEVNGTPIYANRVLSQVEKDLAAKARDLDVKQFSQYALQKLTEAREYCINNELEFAAAQRNLDEKDRQLADRLTTDWRQRQITEAGGSLELTRRKAATEGLNFDDLVQEQYRKFMTQIYYTKRVLPRIQITAQDMRDYYRTHKDTEFTQHEQVHFRMIKIDPAAVGGREAAIAKVKEAQDKAARGFDFAELAKSYSTDPNLARTGGDVGWIQKGSFRLEKVEQAAFELQPGQVSQNFIEEDGAFYIVKVEERKVGHVQPFDDPTVQDSIYSTLRARQFRALREQVIRQLTANAIIRKNNDLLQTVVEMAMQRYPQWAAAGNA